MEYTLRGKLKQWPHSWRAQCQREGTLAFEHNYVGPPAASDDAAVAAAVAVLRIAERMNVGSSNVLGFHLQMQVVYCDHMDVQGRAEIQVLDEADAELAGSKSPALHDAAAAVQVVAELVSLTFDLAPQHRSHESAEEHPPGLYCTGSQIRRGTL